MQQVQNRSILIYTSIVISMVVVSLCCYKSFPRMQTSFWNFRCSKYIIYDLFNPPETTENCGGREYHCRFFLTVRGLVKFTTGQAFSWSTGVCGCWCQLRNLQSQIDSKCSGIVSRLFISLSLLCTKFGVEIPELAEMQVRKSTQCRSPLRLT